MNPDIAARELARYAKHFGAGAFATPLARDIDPGTIVTDEDTVAIVKRLSAPSRRHDWTARRYTIPAGVTVAMNVARAVLNAPPPAWLVERPDYLVTYVEDELLTAALLAQRPVIATRISAAAELLTTWGPPGLPSHVEAPVDRPSMAEVGSQWFAGVPYPMRTAIAGELAAIDRWYDDYPFYSDGSWGAVSLRGFDPDPLWGVKPAEMPKKWRADHPGWESRRCDWTTLRAPTLQAVTASLRWIGSLERVRLMRMAGTRGKPSVLARHSDITDRNAGTRPGQIARFHLPLASHPAITMTTWELNGEARTKHLEPWHLYYLDQRKPHSVTNPTPTDRIHLVIDAIVDPNVRSVIESLA